MQMSDRVSGAIIIALGVLAVVSGLQLPPMVGQEVGPSAFPIVVGAGLIISGLLVVLGVGHRLEEEALVELAVHQPEELHSKADPRRAWRALIPPALLIVYVAVVGSLGFVPTAALIVLVMSLALGARLQLALPLAVVAPLGVQLVFAKLLRVPLPAGLLPMPW